MVVSNGAGAVTTYSSNLSKPVEEKERGAHIGAHGSLGGCEEAQRAANRQWRRRGCRRRGRPRAAAVRLPGLDPLLWSTKTTMAVSPRYRLVARDGCGVRRRRGGGDHGARLSSGSSVGRGREGVAARV